MRAASVFVSGRFWYQSKGLGTHISESIHIWDSLPTCVIGLH
jgi:hypothetical protein